MTMKMLSLLSHFHAIRVKANEPPSLLFLNVLSLGKAMGDNVFSCAAVAAEELNRQDWRLLRQALPHARTPFCFVEAEAYLF